MLAESPTHLATQAEQLMQQALTCERDASHAPTAQAVQLAIQACTVYMHQAAVLREKKLSVDVRYGVYASETVFAYSLTAQAVQLAIQACTVYLHQAAVLRARNLSVDVRDGV